MNALLDFSFPRAGSALLVFSLTAFSAGCLLTDHANLAPPDALPATEVADALEQTVRLNFLMGGRLFCEQFSTSLCHDRLGSSMAEGALLAGFLARRNAKIQANRSYRQSSVTECQQTAGSLTHALTFAHLNAKKICSDVGCAPPDSTEVQVAALSAGLAARRCRLVPTGQVIAPLF